MAPFPTTPHQIRANLVHVQHLMSSWLLTFGTYNLNSVRFLPSKYNIILTKIIWLCIVIKNYEIMQFKTKFQILLSYLCIYGPQCTYPLRATMRRWPSHPRLIFYSYNSSLSWKITSLSWRPGTTLIKQISSSLKILLCLQTVSIWYLKLM